MSENSLDGRRQELLIWVSIPLLFSVLDKAVFFSGEEGHWPVKTVFFLRDVQGKYSMCYCVTVNMLTMVLGFSRPSSLNNGGDFEGTVST